MNKLVVMLVIMVLGFGFMHFRYSKMTARRHNHAAAQKAREADAKFERVDFSTAALDDELKQGANEACKVEIGRYVILALAPNQQEDFCRCLAVHLVTHVYPLVGEACRTSGRLDFNDPACAPLDGKKPHLVMDRSQLIGRECAAWAKAGAPAVPTVPVPDSAPPAAGF